MHLEPDWSKLAVSASKNVSCSPYMKELVQFIHRVYAAYLTGFENKQVLTEKYTLAIHLICFSWFFLFFI